MFSTIPRLNENPQALVTERISVVQRGALAQFPLIPALRIHRISRYQNSNLSETLNIFPETKHYFPLRNSVLLELLSNTDVLMVLIYLLNRN